MFVPGAGCGVWLSPSLTPAVTDVGNGWRCSPSSVLCLGKESNSMSIRSNEICLFFSRIHFLMILAPKRFFAVASALNGALFVDSPVLKKKK